MVALPVGTNRPRCFLNPNGIPLTTVPALFSAYRMQLNEHQSKILFSEAAIPTPPGLLVHPEDLSASFEPPAGMPLPWMLKVQVLAGGRGKQGGVVGVSTRDEIVDVGRRLFALQFGGQHPPFLRLESRASIAREFYLSLAVQREWASVVFTVGRQGGVDVESAGANDPENLLIQRVDALAGLCAHNIRAAFFHLDLNASLWSGFQELVRNVWQCFTANGLLLAEINPLALTPEQQWLALDGKVEMDDNHVDLHPELKRFEQAVYFTPQELRAKAAGLSYHKFNGRVGLMVNGAGLAMATMDLLNFSGLEPANFLDLGGGAGQQAVDTAMDILLGDEQVEAVLINLFGGILSCEKVAASLIAALGGKAPAKPLVVRLSGHGAEAGRALLADVPGADLHVTNNLNQALEILTEVVSSRTVTTGVFSQTASSPVHHVHSGTGGKLSLHPFDLGRSSQVLVQGLTGREGQRHARLMLEYGVRVVAGVTPFKGGQVILDLPVYSSVAQAARRHRIDASILFVPAAVAADAILEAAQAEIPWIICITEGIPQMDMLRVVEQLKGFKSRLIGPNTPGVIVPGEIKIGIMPGHIFSPGPVAVLSRSGTLTYETVHRLKGAGIGQSVCIGVGGDPYVGLGLKECGELVAVDPRTEALIILGEIGGQAEEQAAEHLRRIGWDGPILAFIVGLTAPEGKRLGHAGAILEKGKGGVKSKLDRLRAANVTVCENLDSIARLTAQGLSKR
jgi:succinyl-CoA synthetase alpha subunit